ncbi:MAG: glycosyltransferase [Acidimicrobiales bacterium]
MSGPGERPLLRIWVHALDRTGPPVLVRTLLAWLVEVRPDLRLEVLAFRGGEMEGEVASLAPVRVVLDDHEPWEHASPDPARLDELRGRFADLEVAAANLLVSTSAAQALQVVGEVGPIVAWSVEIGEDLHWLDGPVPVRARVDRWLAGSAGTAAELQGRLGHPVPVAHEFVAGPAVAASPDEARDAVGVPVDLPLVVGAGIGTHRKGVDLFLEAALAASRLAPEVQFCWVGGAADPLRPRVADLAERLGLASFHVAPSTPALDDVLAAADAFAHPARVDAFPLVCLHAALVATPVVGFAGCGGLQEMFGPTARLVPYPDVAALADAVVALAIERRSGATGPSQQAHVAARYRVEVAAPALLDALADLVGTGS